MGQKFFWISFSTSEDCTQRHHFATSVSSQFEPSRKQNNKFNAIHYYSWRTNLRALCWRKKLMSTDVLFIFKLSCDPVFTYKVFKNSPKFNCQQALAEDRNFFLVFSYLWEDSVTQFFSKYVPSIESVYQEYTNIQTSRKERVNTVLLKDHILLARHTGQWHRRWFLCWVCSKVQVVQYLFCHVLKGRCFKMGKAVINTLPATLKASNHLQLPGPDIIFIRIIDPNGFFSQEFISF